MHCAQNGLVQFLLIHRRPIEWMEVEVQRKSMELLEILNLQELNGPHKQKDKSYITAFYFSFYHDDSK